MLDRGVPGVVQPRVSQARGLEQPLPLAVVGAGVDGLPGLPDAARNPPIAGKRAPGLDTRRVTVLMPLLGRVFR